jgi:hypothetical protein
MQSDVSIYLSRVPSTSTLLGESKLGLEDSCNGLLRELFLREDDIGSFIRSGMSTGLGDLLRGPSLVWTTPCTTTKRPPAGAAWLMGRFCVLFASVGLKSRSDTCSCCC